MIEDSRLDDMTYSCIASLGSNLGKGRIAMKVNLVAGLLHGALLLVVLTAGCSLPDTAVWLYVDNTGNDELVVTVDGKNETRVAAGEVESVRGLYPGEHQIVIRRGDEVVYDEKKAFKPTEIFGSVRKFLVNPDGEQRYAIYTAEYGHNPFKGSTRSIVGGLMGQMPTETQFDFHDLKKAVTPLPAERFVDLGNTEYILTDPPDSVRTSSTSAQRTVVTRVEQGDHKKLLVARDNLEPTRADVKRLQEVCERVMFRLQDE